MEIFPIILKEAQVMKRQFNTDCEGPITKNDNAFEIAQKFIPHGDKFFTKLSKYDDFLADIVRKPGYKAGDTLRLILPFFKAYGLTDKDIRDFSLRNILLVPEAHNTINYISSIMPSFIISTSYCPYINALCDLIGFPYENAYCTKLNMDVCVIDDEEIYYLRKLYDEIIDLPSIVLPSKAISKSELSEDTTICIDHLDEIFWDILPQTQAGKLLEIVNPVGGFEKAQAIKNSCSKTGLTPGDVLYIGDSITDTEAMKLVRESGGLAVAFNGNRYAIESAQIACTSSDTRIISLLASAFESGGVDAVFSIASGWMTNPDKNNLIEKICGRSMPVSNDVRLYITAESSIDEVISFSEDFRKTVRGKAIGKLG
ncbi:HAD hydrolase family protein [Candidatus Poribacteria bacterium]|nr:HAD hydrolase family protein [Candidatus Poribacteria bacterium]